MKIQIVMGRSYFRQPFITNCSIVKNKYKVVFGKKFNFYFFSIIFWKKPVEAPWSKCGVLKGDKNDNNR